MRALASRLALIGVVACLGAVSANSPPALAQAEDRGYGGPATVGPNFSTGKQSAPPDYGSGTPAKKPAVKPKPLQKVAKPSKLPPVKSAGKPPSTKPAQSNDVAKSSPEVEKPEDASAAPAADAGKDTADAAQPKLCRRFDATTSTTLAVPCD